MKKKNKLNVLLSFTKLCVTTAPMQPNHIKNEIVYIKQTLREQDKPKPLNISHCIWNPGSRYSNAKHISKERNIDILLSFITKKNLPSLFFRAN